MDNIDAKFEKHNQEMEKLIGNFLQKESYASLEELNFNSDLIRDDQLPDLKQNNLTDNINILKSEIYHLKKQNIYLNTILEDICQYTAQNK